MLECYCRYHPDLEFVKTKTKEMKGKHGDHFKKNGEKIDRTTKKEGDRSLDFNMFQFN